MIPIIPLMIGFWAIPFGTLLLLSQQGVINPTLYATIASTPATAIDRLLQEITYHLTEIWIELSARHAPQVFLQELDQRWGTSSSHGSSGVCIAPGHWSARPSRSLVERATNFVRHHASQWPLLIACIMFLLISSMLLIRRVCRMYPDRISPRTRGERDTVSGIEILSTWRTDVGIVFLLRIRTANGRVLEFLYIAPTIVGSQPAGSPAHATMPPHATIQGEEDELREASTDNSAVLRLVDTSECREANVPAQNDSRGVEALATGTANFGQASGVVAHRDSSDSTRPDGESATSSPAPEPNATSDETPKVDQQHGEGSSTRQVPASGPSEPSASSSLNWYELGPRRFPETVAPFRPPRPLNMTDSLRWMAEELRSRSAYRENGYARAASQPTDPGDARATRNSDSESLNGLE